MEEELDGISAPSILFPLLNAVNDLPMKESDTPPKVSIFRESKRFSFSS